MYYYYIAFLTLMKSINPHLTKYAALSILESDETMYIDSILIFFIVFCILLYKYLFKNNEIVKTIQNFKKLSKFQMFLIFILSFLSVVTSICIYELDKKYDNLFINRTITKTASMILLFLVGFLFFQEKYNIKKVFGVIFAIISVYLLY
jgi:drug/metabolite transporter (DMT)-like permease